MHTLLAERGYEVHEHQVTADFDRPNDAAAFPDLAGYDVVVPMGSVRSLTATDEIDSWIFEEIDMVRAAHERGTPILGICFGAQLLATALGGSVERAPVTEIGWYEIFEHEESVNPVGPGPWFQWHHDRCKVPADAQVLAVNDNAVQLFRCERSVGTQFHPEVTYQHLEGFLSGASEDYVNEHGIDPARLLAQMRSNEVRNARQCAALLDWFLDEVADS